MNIKKYEIILDEVRNVYDKMKLNFKNLDDKFNMLIVFNTLLVMFFELLKPSNLLIHCFCKLSLCEIYIIIYENIIYYGYIIFLATTLINILLGLNLKPVFYYNVDKLTQNEFMNETEEDSLKDLIEVYQRHIKSLDKAIINKQKSYKASIILSIINICIIAIGVLI